LRKFEGPLAASLCGALAVLIIVMSILASARLSAVQSENRALLAERDRLQSEARILQVRLEMSMPLEELERYATEVLGMQRPHAGQIIYPAK